MSNNPTTVQDSTFEMAERVFLYRISYTEIGRKCRPRVADSVVLRVLRGEMPTGEVRERVIPVAARLVRAYEKKHNISVGGGN